MRNINKRKARKVTDHETLCRTQQACCKSADSEARSSPSLCLQRVTTSPPSLSLLPCLLSSSLRANPKAAFPTRQALFNVQVGGGGALSRVARQQAWRRALDRRGECLRAVFTPRERLHVHFQGRRTSKASKRAGMPCDVRRR